MDCQSFSCCLGNITLCQGLAPVVYLISLEIILEMAKTREYKVLRRTWEGTGLLNTELRVKSNIPHVIPLICTDVKRENNLLRYSNKHQPD